MSRVSFAVLAAAGWLAALIPGASATELATTAAGGTTRVASLDAAAPTDAAPAVDPVSGRPIVPLAGAHEAGTLVVDNSERRLFLSLGDGKAIAYPVAIGKRGRSWTGETRVSAKVRNPSWVPTPNILRENPHLPRYVAPGPKNPLGPRALYLAKGYYRIHGTNAPASIGRAASNGCIRMYNKDVVELFARVDVGARVVVVE